MEKEKITLPIGNNKALIFEAEPGNKADQDFAKLCKEVAATQSQSIQDFFTRLSNSNNLLQPAERRAGKCKASLSTFQRQTIINHLKISEQ